jgi:hypothetical protein
MSGEEGGAQHGKSVRNMGKGVRNMGKGVRNMRKGVRNIRNTLRNIMIRRLICFLIRIVWLRRCPIQAPGSDVRALAVPKCFFSKETFAHMNIRMHRHEHNTRRAILFKTKNNERFFSFTI